jgi:hypothetical protein
MKDNLESEILMGSSTSADLYNVASETTAKYVYFLLSIAGAAIAYSVEVAADLKPSWILLLLGMALLAWGVSFYAGCKNLQFEMSIQNLLFHAQQDAESMQALQKQQLQLTEELSEVRKMYEETVGSHNMALSKHGESASKYIAMQFQFMLLGGAFFVIWRVVEMFFHS